MQESAKIQASKVARLIQHLMDERHRRDPVLARAKHLSHGRLLQARRTKIEQAVHELQIILHPMMNFAQKQFLLPERALDSLLRGATPRLGFYLVNRYADVTSHCGPQLDLVPV